MRETINARIPLQLEQKLAEYCAKHAVTRSGVVVQALDEFLDRDAGGVNAYSLAADLIPPRGVNALQSGKVRELARRAFRGRRTR